MKEENKTEYKMYFFSNYQFGNTQHCGIQAVHSVTEYSNKYFKTKEYQQWATIKKSVVILNGGTTGKNSGMEARVNELNNFKIRYATFCEEDLNDAMTSIAFLLPNTIYDFDYKEYEKEVLDGYHHTSTHRHNYEVKIWLKQFKLV